MDGIIVYGSRYGTARTYAEELARRMGFACASYDQAGDLGAYRSVAYVGALYAGGVVGMRKTFARHVDWEGKTIAVVTVGLADPADEHYAGVIDDQVRRQLPNGLFDHVRVFHLRGGIDYGRLRFKHRAMLDVACRRVKDMPAERQTADVRAMLETYHRQVSFVDLASLDQVVRALQETEPQNPGKGGL